MKVYLLDRRQAERYLNDYCMLTNFLFNVAIF